MLDHYRPEQPATDLRWEILPNRSLSRQRWVWFVTAVLLVELLIGAGFLLVGAWLVLPFGGLEGLVVAVAVYAVIGHDTDYEVVEITDGQLVIIKRDGKVESRYEFQTYWARVMMVRRTVDWYAPQLVVRSHGRQVEIGASMNEENKRAFAQTLEEYVGLAYR